MLHAILSVFQYKGKGYIGNDPIYPSLKYYKESIPINSRHSVSTACFCQVHPD